MSSGVRLPFLARCISAARSGRGQVVDTDDDDAVDADGALAVRLCAVRRRRLEHVAGFAAVPPEHAVRAGEDVARVDVPVEGWVELGSDEGVGCRQSSPTPSPTSRELDQPLVPELCPLCRNFSLLCHYLPLSARWCPCSCYSTHADLSAINIAGVAPKLGQQPRGVPLCGLSSGELMFGFVECAVAEHGVEDIAASAG